MILFSTSYRRHSQMHGEIAAASGYENSAAEQPEEYLTESLESFTNLVSATYEYRGAKSTLTESNEIISKQLEEQAKSLKETTVLIKKELKECSVNSEFSPHKTFTPSPDN